MLWPRLVTDEDKLTVHGQTILQSNNQLEICWAKGEKYPSEHAEYIDVHINFIRDLIKDETLDIKYITTEENCADALTKPLGWIALYRIMSWIGPRNITEDKR